VIPPGSAVIQLNADELESMSLEELKDFASEELGLDVSSMGDRSLVLQQILAQDESMEEGGE
jgi:hypothetical protein